MLLNLVSLFFHLWEISSFLFAIVKLFLLFMIMTILALFQNSPISCLTKCHVGMCAPTIEIGENKTTPFPGLVAEVLWINPTFFLDINLSHRGPQVGLQMVRASSRILLKGPLEIRDCQETTFLKKIKIHSLIYSYIPWPETEGYTLYILQRNSTFVSQEEMGCSILFDWIVDPAPCLKKPFASIGMLLWKEEVR